MTRKGWKIAFGISLTLLILSFVFLLFLYGAAAMLMTMWTAGLGQELPEYQSFWEFYATFPGSPMFWLVLADGAVLILSTVMLIIKK